MKMLCLNIRQQYGQIDIKSQNAKLDITARLGEMDMTSQAAVFEMSVEKRGLDIDATPSRYSIGIKNNADFSRDMAQEGMQAIKEFTARIVDNGNQMQNAANNPSIIADIAYSNARTSRPAPSVSVTDHALPDVRYTPDELRISYRRGRVDIKVEPPRFENNSQKGSVSITLAREASVRMWVSEDKFDMYA